MEASRRGPVWVSKARLLPSETDRLGWTINFAHPGAIVMLLPILDAVESFGMMMMGPKGSVHFPRTTYLRTGPRCRSNQPSVSRISSFRGRLWLVSYRRITFSVLGVPRFSKNGICDVSSGK